MYALNDSIRQKVLITVFSLSIGALFALAPDKICWPFIIALGGVLLGIFVTSTFKPEERKVLLNIFLVALFLRLLLALLLYDASFCLIPRNEGNFIGDGYGYHYTGAHLSQLWHRGVFPDKLAFEGRTASGALLSSYDYWCAFIYFFTGRNIMALFFINSLVGAFTIILIYLIAKRLFGKKVAVAAALFCAFWPSLILWSTQNLKDPITIFLTAISIWAIVSLRYKFKPRYVLFLILSILALSRWQEFVPVVFGLAIILSLLFSADQKKVIRIIIATGAVVLLTLPAGVPQIIFLKAKAGLIYVMSKYSLNLQAIDHVRHARTLDAYSAFLANANISSPLRMLIFLPFGFIFVLLAPFPWQFGGFSQILATPEMLLWYILLPFTFRGVLFSLKKRWKQSSAIILFIILMCGLLAVYEGNIGTLFRHRSIVLAFLFIFTSVGIIQAREEWNKKYYA